MSWNNTTTAWLLLPSGIQTTLWQAAYSLPHLLKGAADYLDESQCKVSLDAAVEDQSEEIESLLNGIQIDNQLADRTFSQTSDNESSPNQQKMATAVSSTSGPGTDTLSENLKKASVGIIVNTTLSDYKQ